MTILNIVKYPEKILLQIAEKVKPKEISQYQTLIEDMMETMWKKALGLSAPQIGISKRIIIYIGDDKNVDVLINPVIVTSKGKITSELEGCLSIPNIRRNIKRAKEIMVEGLDREGNAIIPFSPKRKMTTIVIQHEIDHLNGITILDGSKKRNLINQNRRR